jgi:hypothetical protein
MFSKLLGIVEHLFHLAQQITLELFSMFSTGVIFLAVIVGAWIQWVSHKRPLAQSALAWITTL